MKTKYFALLCFFVGISAHAFQPVENKIVVLFKNSMPELQQRTLQSLNLDGNIQARPAMRSHPQIQVLKMNSPSEVTSTLEQLRQHPEVQFAEPNYSAHLLGNDLKTPNDPSFPDQWHLHNTGQEDSDHSAGTPGADINILPAWNAGFHGSRQVLVAIIDGGMDWTHPDLQDNLYTNPGEAGDKSNNGIDDDNNGYVDDVHGYNFVDHNNNTGDENGHGSHIAGVIGASGNNGIGVTGINWEVSMMPVKAFNGMGAGSLQSVVEATTYALKMKAKIINNSWAMGDHSDILKSLMEEAQKQGVLVVAGAGNNYINLDGYELFPVSYPYDNIVGVAATDNKDIAWTLTDTGPKTVHIAAPGVNILSTWKKGGYKTDTGTSMATPVVTGLAALLWAAHPDWNYKQIKQRMIDSCVPSANLRHKVVCQGRLDAWNAVQGVKPTNPFPQNAQFKSIPADIETPHPYPDGVYICYPASKPGAKYIRLHIDQLILEWEHDHVYVENPQGNIVEEFYGTMYNYSTDYVEGDSLQICLKTDRSVHYYGFKVDAIEYVE